MNGALTRFYTYGFHEEQIDKIHNICLKLSKTTMASYYYWVNQLASLLKTMGHVERETWINRLMDNPEPLIQTFNSFGGLVDMSHLLRNETVVPLSSAGSKLLQSIKRSIDGELAVYPSESFRGRCKHMNKVDKLLKLVEELNTLREELRLLNETGLNETKIVITLANHDIVLNNRVEVLAIVTQQRRERIDQITKQIEAANVALNMVTLL
ncbi:hypothetical protein D3C75_333280 [compost metagenome]